MFDSRPRRWFGALALALAFLVGEPQAALGASVRLTTEPLTANVRSFKISPDGKYVVYEVRSFGAEGWWALYSVPIAGGAQTLLMSHPTTDAGGELL